MILPLSLATLALPVLAGDEESEVDDEVRMVLASCDFGRPAEHPFLTDQLVDLGDPALAALIGHYVGRTPWPVAEGSAPPAEGAARAFLTDALRRWEPQEVADALLAGPPAGDAPEEWLAACGLVGDLGNGRVLCALIVGLDAAEAPWLVSPMVGDAVGRAVERVLEQDPEAVTFLGRMNPRTRRELRVAVARALGRVSPPGAVGCLAGMVGRSDEEVDLALLEALGSLTGPEGVLYCGERAAVVRPHLRATSALIRRQAAHALGRIGDRRACGELVEALEDEDPLVRRTAHGALVLLSGRELPGEHGAWRAWLERELAWLDEQAPKLVLSLRAADPGVVVSALRQLSDHPLLSPDLTREIVGVLSRDDRTIQLAACAALERLGDLDAVVDLVGLLDDPRRDVQEAAATALAALTGAQLPADPEAWEAWRR